MTRSDPADAGFTLVEVLTSLAVIGVVLTAVTTFFVHSMVTINLQGARQVAIQVASTDLERLRALNGQSALDWLMARYAEGPTDVTDAEGPTRYQQTWDCRDGNGAACNGPALNAQLAGQPLFLGATVTITWAGQDCTNNRCSYSATTKISIATGEPLFGQS